MMLQLVSRKGMLVLGGQGHLSSGGSPSIVVWLNVNLMLGWSLFIFSKKVCTSFVDPMRIVNMSSKNLLRNKSLFASPAMFLIFWSNFLAKKMLA